MSFEIQRGLFGLDIVDYHAILGLPLNCDPNLVRQRYLKIAPLLHPDTCPADTPAGKEQARQLMSKLVNPAYATLANEKKRSEHEAVLRLLRDRLPQQKNKVRIQSEAAKSLAQNPNFAQVYGQLVQKIAQDQYSDLNQVLDRIADASELNLIYLARLTAAQGAKARITNPMVARPSSSGNTAARAAAAPANDPPAISKNPLVVRSYQRAQECIEHSNLAQAVLELKDAIKSEGTNSACHALLGKTYLQQKQTTLAKVHLTRALAIDPNNAIAKAAKRDLDRILGNADASASSSKPAAKTIARSKPDSGGGLFGGLFGGKKR